MKVKFCTFLMLAAALFLSACGKSDADLQKAAADKLAAEKVSGVTVTVKDGIATLSGEAADITVKNKAEAAVKGVEGIKTVNNNATLKPLPAAPSMTADDEMLQGKIQENIKKLNVDTVKAQVKDGVVTLTGEVKKADLAKVMQAAQEAGAKKPENQLTVK
jgi:hyperosmotically inducible periplasmic protein